MSVSYDELALRHPCFAKGKKGETGRIHLPVSPGCNIACRFCDRKLNDYEERPGVTAEILTPEEALEAVGRAVETVPNIQVVGIAGPGDTLASDNALNTFRLVKKKYPQLIACMSTNGLLLPERAAEIAEVGIDSLTVTMNAVDPEIEAQLIFVITTCAAGIIGDDVESVTNAAEAELGIPVVAVFCEGFRSKMWTSGFDAGYHGIARKIIKPAEKKRNIINVINFWGSDIFKEWFNEFGYEPNYITPFSTVDSLSHSSEAALTVQACSTLGSYLGAALEQEFGVREIRNSPPYGIAQTDRWFRELGQIIGKEAEVEKFLQRKKAEYMPKIEELRKKLEGKTAYVTAGASHGHSLLALLSELGMKPAGAAIFHHDPLYDNESKDSDTLAHTVADYGNVKNYNVCNKQEFELVNVLNRVRPDILLARHGGMTLWGAKFGIPSLLVGDEHFGMGYEGLVNYGERILETLENDEFVKNLEKHSVNPYTKWWLEQEPYTFLGGNF